MIISKDNNVQELKEKLSQEGIDEEKLNNALNIKKAEAEKTLQDKEKTHKVLNSARDLCAKYLKNLLISLM